MASIVINGDTSGGVTLAAPAIAGTPTITLPTTNGTLVLADSSGNVGIGTTSPEAALSITRQTTGQPSAAGVHISNESSGYSYIQMNATNGAYIDFSNGGGTDFKGRIIYFNATHKFDFATNEAVQMSLQSNGNFQFNSGYGSVATAYGCRAWVRFTVSSGTPSLIAQGNVSSIGDNAVGDFTMNFINAMPDENYVPMGYTNYISASSGDAAFLGARDPNSNTWYATSGFRFRTQTGAGTIIDPATVSVAIIR